MANRTYMCIKAKHRQAINQVQNKRYIYKTNHKSCAYEPLKQLYNNNSGTTVTVQYRREGSNRPGVPINDKGFISTTFLAKKEDDMMKLLQRKIERQKMKNETK